MGLSAPKANQPARSVTGSPALSQIGGVWPPDGRIIGIIVDPTSLDGVREVKDAITAAGMVPLLIAPHGGSLDGGLDVQRTFLTARSVEFDALLLAGSPPSAPDALASRDAKTGNPGKPSTVDPRVVMMIEECFRHAKAIGGWGTARTALDAAGCTSADLGVIVGEDPSDVLDQVMKLLGTHRVWDRFPTIVA